MSELRLDCSELSAEVVLNTPEEDFVLDAAEASAEVVLDGRWVDRPIWTLIKGAVAGRSEITGQESVTRQLSGSIDAHSEVTGNVSRSIYLSGTIAGHSGVEGTAIIPKIVQARGRVYTRGGIGFRSLILHKKDDAMFPYVMRCKEFMPLTWPKIGALRLGKNTYTYYNWQNFVLPSPLNNFCEFTSSALRNGNIFWPFSNQTFLDGEAMGYAITSFYYDIEQNALAHLAGATVIVPASGYAPWLAKAAPMGTLRILRNDASPEEVIDDVLHEYPWGSFGRFLLPAPLSRAIGVGGAVLQFYTPRDH